MSSISSEEIISILKSEIENFDSEATDKETGTVIWVGDVSQPFTALNMLCTVKSWYLTTA